MDMIHQYGTSNIKNIYNYRNVRKIYVPYSHSLIRVSINISYSALFIDIVI